MSKIKLAIADDELTSRNTIKNYLKDNEEYEVVADFSDGKSALDWLRQNEVDILLCDMQMPEINGVELMRLVHVINEFLPVIAISGFDNFDYVRGSLVNGAANYLLKHELTKEGLISTLDQVKEKYRIVPHEKTFCRRTGYCIRDAKKFTEENIKTLLKKGEISFECCNVVALAISPDYRFPDQGSASEYKQDVLSAVMDMLAQILGQDYPYLVYVTKKSHLIVLVSFYEVRSNLYMINTLKNLTGRLQRQIIRMLALTSTMVIGEVQTELGKAVQQGLDMEKILEDKIYLGGNRVVAYAVAGKLNYGTGQIPERLWKQLDFELEKGFTGDLDALTEIFNVMEEQRFPRDKVEEICREILRRICRDDNRIENMRQVYSRIEEYEIFEEFRGEIMEICHRIQAKKAEKKNAFSPLVAQAINYIEQNYDREISLESCALSVGSSYTYLSRAFKQETGMRFVEYLNQRRVNKAKSLLIRGELSMKEIVEQSGFRNYNYFFKVFKESEGVTPSEFAAKN